MVKSMVTWLTGGNDVTMRFIVTIFSDILLTARASFNWRSASNKELPLSVDFFLFKIELSFFYFVSTVLLAWKAQFLFENTCKKTENLRLIGFYL